MQETITAGTEVVASTSERAAVAELMAPSERLVGQPPLYQPKAVIILVSPGKPVDDEDDDD